MHAVPQVLISFPISRALPKEFFHSHIGVVVFVIRDFEYELINLYAIVVHGVKCGLYPGNCWLKVERKYGNSEGARAGLLKAVTHGVCCG